jgi:hypothetical protein
MPSQSQSDLATEFLWINRYCIPQMIKTREHTGATDLIYQHTEVILIVEFGDDPRTDLPGVGATLKAHVQPRTNIDGQMLASTIRRPQCLIDKSTWSTRGWTFKHTFTPAVNWFSPLNRPYRPRPSWVFSD